MGSLDQSNRASSVRSMLLFSQARALLLLRGMWTGCGGFESQLHQK